jgi:hypothetical protein
LVALVTLKFFALAEDAVEFTPEFPAVAAAELPEALALEPMLAEPSCPVTCTSFPINVRTAFKFPLNW